MTGGLDYLLEKNAEINQELGMSTAYRYFVLPTIQSLPSRAHQDVFREVVLFNLHVHLWFGVIVGVVFADPRIHSPRFINDFDEVHLPSLRKPLGLYSPDFFTKPVNLIVEEYGDQVRDRLRQFADFLLPSVRFGFGMTNRTTRAIVCRGALEGRSEVAYGVT